MLGDRDRQDSIQSLGFAFDPARGRWRAIAPPPIDDARETAWTGSLLLVAAPDRQMAAYDPTADCWLLMPEMPLPELPENARRPPRKAVTADTRPFSDKLKRAISSRRKTASPLTPTSCARSCADPYQPESRQHGFPMTEAESQDLLTRSSFAGRASDIQKWLRNLPTFGGLWQDQRVGGDIVIALTGGRLRGAPGASTSASPRTTRRRPGGWSIVPRTERELKRALWRVGAVSKRLDPAAMLWAAGVDLSAGRLSLTYDPDDVGRMRPRKKELEKGLGVPVRITSGRVTGQ